MIGKVKKQKRGDDEVCKFLRKMRKVKMKERYENKNDISCLFENRKEITK